jgi:hypothetical protein
MYTAIPSGWHSASRVWGLQKILGVGYAWRRRGWCGVRLETAGVVWGTLGDSGGDGRVKGRGWCGVRLETAVGAAIEETGAHPLRHSLNYIAVAAVAQPLRYSSGHPTA